MQRQSICWFAYPDQISQLDQFNLFVEVLAIRIEAILRLVAFFIEFVIRRIQNAIGNHFILRNSYFQETAGFMHECH